MPAETVVAFQDHGKVAVTLTEGVAEARKLLERLAEVGVDYDDVVERSHVVVDLRNATGRNGKSSEKVWKL